MDARTRKRLEGAGWTVSDAGEFLKLSEDEAAFIDLKLALADDLRSRRTAQNLTQRELADLVGSSQSRIAKMEAADWTVSIDLLLRTLLRIGADRKDIGRTLSSAPVAAAR